MCCIIYFFFNVCYFSSWQRETRMKTVDGRLQGDVAYYAPCGKRLRQYPDVVKVTFTCLPRCLALRPPQTPRKPHSPPLSSPSAHLAFIGVRSSRSLRCTVMASVLGCFQFGTIIVLMALWMSCLTKSLLFSLL